MPASPELPAVGPASALGARTGVDLARTADRLRLLALEMIAKAGSGHPGGSFSAAEIVAALFFRVMRHDPKRPEWPARDRFILSKGHAAPILYAALAEAGYIERGELDTLRRVGSRLQGHPSVRDLPYVEASTGSLGQGLSVAAGLALGARMDGADVRVFALLGDGECQEGQVWEAAMFAAHHRLSNLVAIVDRNAFQLDGPTEAIVALEPLAAKWRAFGWDVVEVDGHDAEAVAAALDVPRPDGRRAARPRAVVARTVKGRGVSFMEGQNEFHGRAPTPEELERARAEIVARLGEAGVRRA